MKYVFAFLTILSLAACRAGSGQPAPDSQDTTTVEVDTMVFDTAGVDTFFPND